MRTTVTLDPDVAATLKRLMRERNTTFKALLNATLRAGLGQQAGAARPFMVRARSWGTRPGVSFHKALQLADAVEDQDTMRKWERTA